MTDAQPLAILRKSAWSGIPSSPGIYWWYFPRAELDHLGIAKLCDVSELRLRISRDDMVCLYHGMANNLSERVEWHAAQKLTPGNLRSGFLSTFRFTLLALNDFDYTHGGRHIDEYFDGLSISWQESSTREEAAAMERAEFQGVYHYPLNIQGNKRDELFDYVRHLKSARIAYKRRYS